FLQYSSSFLDPCNPAKEHSNLLKGNIKARMRMMFLYDMAGNKNCLVSGTSNLSELNLGYITKHGDGACDIEPIGDYYKTEIFEMAKVLGIPQRIIEKPPSADLWEGQTDEDDLGIIYKELDRILVGLRTSNRKILDEVDVEQLVRVQDMVRGSYHKRKPPPSYNRSQGFKKPVDFSAIV
ncbi:hypothetical protein LCGC14_2546230, partial [marine sediment metagenome]